MASERDEIREQLRRKRREKEEQRRRQQQQQRAMFLRLGAVLAVLVLAGGLIFWAAGRNPEHPTQEPGESQTDAQNAVQNNSQNEDREEGIFSGNTTTTIHMRAAGDLNVTDEMVMDAMTVSGYDFTEAFLDVAPALADADLTILNFEGTLAGAPYGTQRGSAPQSIVQTLIDMGVDVVQTANSAAIRAGVLGLQSTISGFENSGIYAVGTFMDSEDFKNTGGYTIVEVEGIRIALVGFTKGMDNLGLPEGSEDCVNLLYEDYTSDYKTVDTDGINKVLRKVRDEQPDLTIALLHWGSELKEEISSSQKRICNLMMDGGVDVILGTHSHLLQAMELDEENNTFVAWSLGDFYGNAEDPATNYSVILDLEIMKDNLTDEVTIEGFSTTPIYTLKPEESIQGGQRVVRIHEAMARYENKYLGRITESVYAGMEHALTRIEERIAGE